MAVMLTKELTVSKWQDMVKKNGIKDNGLIKVLGGLPSSVKEEDPDALGKALDEIEKLVDKLQGDKKVAANADLCKYLDEMVKAVGRARTEVTKLEKEAKKEEADAAKEAKKQEAKKEADDAEKDDEGEEDEDETDADAGKYASRLKELLATVKKGSASGLKCQLVIAEKGGQYAVAIAKPGSKVGPKQKQFLADMLGGGRCLPPGTVSFQNGKYDFALDAAKGGMATKLQKTLQDTTGKKYALKVGKEEVDDFDEETKKPEKGEKTEEKPNPDAEPKPKDEVPPEKASGGVHIGGSVGYRGKNNADDVLAVQRALNKSESAGLAEDGKFGPKTLKAIQTYQKKIGFAVPDGLVEPGGPTESWLNGKKVPIPKPKGGGGTAKQKGAVGAVGDAADAGGDAVAKGKSPSGGGAGDTSTKKPDEGGMSKEPNKSVPPEGVDDPIAQQCKAVVDDANKTTDRVESSKQEAEKKFDEALKKIKRAQTEGQSIPDDAKKFLKELEESYEKRRKALADAKQAVIDAGIAAGKAKAQEEIAAAKKLLDDAKKAADENVKKVNDAANSALDWLSKKVSKVARS